MKKKKFYYKIIFSFSLFIVTLSSIIYIYEVRNKIKLFFLGEFIVPSKDEHRKLKLQNDIYWANEILKGGYILHFRHAERDKWIDVQMYDALESHLHSNGKNESRYAENDYFSEAVCLNDRGKIQAKAIGESLKYIGLPVGAVHSSVSCRARQTAELAFGRYDKMYRILVHRGPYNESEYERIKKLKNLYSNFKEIKGKIKLDDTGLKYKDKRYYYWSKTEAKGNYGKRMRQLIDGSKPEEVFFDGDLEKKKAGSEYFGVGTVSTSYCDNFIAYSLDLKGSEYYTIYLRDLRTGKNEKDIIENTSGSVTWALDNKSFFYSKLDQYHRPRQIFKHVLGTSSDQDQLIFEETDETFTVGIGITSDEKYFIIGTSDHITTEEYFFPTDSKEIKPTLFQKRKNDVRYSIDSWQGYFYVHTNEEARDYKVLRCKTNQIEKLEVFIPAKKETIIGMVEITEVTPKMSYAKIINSSVQDLTSIFKPKSFIVRSIPESAKRNNNQKKQEDMRKKIEEEFDDGW